MGVVIIKTQQGVSVTRSLIRSRVSVGFTSVNNNFAFYKIDGENNDPNPSEMKPWGAADANSIQDETRVNADEALKENQEYMIGQSICTLMERQSAVFDPKDGANAFFKFRINEKVGRIPTSGATGDNDLDEGGAYPWGRGTVQQVAIASLSNNRPCDATEIGIKSEVWRRMVGAANFNGHPSPDVIESYEEDGSTITLGTVTKYMARYSMFKLYARPLGTDKWIDINGDKPFAVRGTSPVPHYNTIHINHSGTSMHEFKIVPVPGSAFYDKWLAGTGVGVHMLDGSMFKPLSQNGAEPVAISKEPYRVYYTGKSGRISATQASNPEWIMNSLDDYEYKRRGPIASLNKYNNNKQPLIPTVNLDDKFIGERYEATGADRSLVQRLRTSRGIENRFYWKGERLSGTVDGRTITVTKGEKTFLYEDGDRKQPYEEAAWGDTVSDFIVELSSDNNRRVVYYTCVYYDSSDRQWRWRWDNKLIQKQPNKTFGWIYKDNNTTRYKLGDRIGVEEEKWYDDAPTDIYKAKGVDNRNIVDGARLLPEPDGRYEFHRNDRIIGYSTNRNLRINNTTRWRATTLVQSAREYEEEFIGQVRIANDDIDGTIGETVTTGAVVNGRDPQDNRRIVRFMIDGERIVTARDPGDDGKPYRVRIGDIEYEANYNQDPIRVGKAGEKKNCFKLKRYQIQDARYEEWAITKQQRVVTYERYAIVREFLDQGQDGHWSIKKTEINRTELEDAKESTVDIIPVDKDNRGTGGRARLEEWSNGGKRWTLERSGRRYVVGEAVQIGKDGPECLVDALDLDDKESITAEKSYNKMIEPGTNYSPLNAVCDYFINSTDDSSHANGPEHTIVFCNELISQNSEEVPQYKDLALLGVRITNSKEWTSFNNVSAWIGNGLRIDRLIGGESGLTATHLFPEIAWALLTDSRIGAGEQIGSESVDRGAMATAARFCEANQFYWDGVIDQKLNLREFIFEQAAYILCDFTIKGGRFALIPSVPYKSDFKINQKGRPEIKALFSDGNMRGMEVTFLSPEERQPFIAVAMYRDETKNGFAETRTLRVKLRGGSDVDPIEEFDMTQFCTSRAQAEIFCKMALKLRSEVDHGIKFETTPQAAMNLEPGEYFRVSSKITHTDRFHSGSVDDKGNVSSSIPLSGGSFRVVYWRPGDTSTSSANMVITEPGKTSTARLFGTIWAKEVDRDVTRVYKVETLAYSEEGLCTVTGSHVPLTRNGTLATLDWNDTDFEVEVG